jgi:hypothetical protein
MSTVTGTTTVVPAATLTASGLDGSATNCWRLVR